MYLIIIVYIFCFFRKYTDIFPLRDVVVIYILIILNYFFLLSLHIYQRTYSCEHNLPYAFSVKWDVLHWRLLAFFFSRRCLGLLLVCLLMVIVGVILTVYFLQNVDSSNNNHFQYKHAAVASDVTLCSTIGKWVDNIAVILCDATASQTTVLW